MPGGDHLNIIDPPGLTVMRIAGGRYRVTAAHRVVWTWMNEFAAIHSGNGDSKQEETMNKLQVGDLVTMTIVDVFETDNQGKLLSYCPTFDNRAIHKTHPATERLRKSSSKIIAALHQAQNSKLAKLIIAQASLVAKSVKRKVGEAVNNYQSPSRSSGSVSGASAIDDHEEFRDEMNRNEEKMQALQLKSSGTEDEKKLDSKNSELHEV